MAANTKQSKLADKDEECAFAWKVFTSWDYGIANVETSHNKVFCCHPFFLFYDETYGECIDL